MDRSAAPDAQVPTSSASPAMTPTPPSDEPASITGESVVSGSSAQAASPAGTAVARPSTRRRRLARRAIGGFAALALVAGIFTAGVGIDRTGILGGPAADQPPADAGDFALVREAWDLLHSRYVGAQDLNGRDLAYGAIQGLTGAVDDPGHTSFMTPEERDRSHQALSGSFVGVGIEVDARDGGTVVVGVLRGSPAAAAGLRQGDRIVAVDGTSVATASLEKVVSLVRGAEGTPVSLTLVRTGAAEPIVVSLVRATIEQPAVSWASVPGSSVVMLRLDQFSSGSADAFKAALKDILATEPSGVVLDLRGNPGGYVNEAIAIASQFLTGGDVHLSRDAQGVVTPTPVEPGGLAPTIPLVVLVDGGTASSAEIVTGAIQDAGRAPIVGQTTFGTGTVVSEVPLSDGSALRIGVIEWLTPKGRSIWRVGLAPDYPVTLAEGATPLVPDDLVGLNPLALRSSGDTQLLKALELLASGPAPRTAE